MSHTAALSNDDEIIDAAFEDAGIIRVRNFSDFMAIAKAFALPPMRGNRVMVMSPAGGFGVISADLCEKAGFEFADPGEEFYQGLNKFTTAGVIKFSNPLDMGDIYDPYMNAHVRYEVIHNDKVDGVIYIGQRPPMPEGDDPLVHLFTADVSKEVYGAILSSGKPLAVCLLRCLRNVERGQGDHQIPDIQQPRRDGARPCGAKGLVCAQDPARRQDPPLVAREGPHGGMDKRPYGRHRGRVARFP